MKKIFTLIAVALVAMSVNAQTTVFSWEGAEAGATVSGGTVVGNGADEGSVNYANSTYWTVRVSSKKANIDTDNITVTLDQALGAGDELAITAYRNKDTDANGTLYILFENGKEIDEGDEVVWNNIALGQEPNTKKYAITEAAGSKSFKLARSKSSTNVFITKIVITSGGTSGIGTVKSETIDVNAPVYNLAGQQVDKSYKGVVIQNGVKRIQK